MAALHVHVSQLRKGDYLPLTKRTVIACSRGARTPSGHHEVYLRRATGRDELLTWRSQTVIDIERPETTRLECSCDDADCFCRAEVSVEDATCFTCLEGIHFHIDEREENFS